MAQRAPILSTHRHPAFHTIPQITLQTLMPDNLLLMALRAR